MKRTIFAHLNKNQNHMFKNYNLIFFLLVLVQTLQGQTLQEGLKQLENENYTAALNTFTSLNATNPKNPIFAYYIGEVHYALENYEAARTSYSIGLNVSSNCDECRVGLAKLDLDNGKFLEAKKNFDSALKGNSKNHALIALVGDAYLYSKKPNVDEALALLTKARDLDPKVAKYWAHLGDAQVLKGDFGSAMTAYETAVEKNKNEPETYVKMAKIWSSSKKYDLATEKLESAIAIAPDYALAYKDLYELYIKSKNYTKVIPVLQKYVALAGSDISAKVRLVKFLCFQAKDYERAIEEGKQIIASNPDQYTIYRWLAWSYGELNKYQESFDQSNLLFSEIAKDTTRKTFSSDYEYLAKAAAKLGKMDIAEKNYTKILETEPSRSSEIYGMLAKTFYDSKDSNKYEKALEWYTKKQNLQALNNTDQYYLGLCLYYLGYYSRADSSFAKVVELTPNYAQGWLMRARCNNSLDPDNVQFLSKPFYEKYIEIASIDKEKNKKNLIESYNYLAYYYIQQNDLIQGKSFYEKIIELDATNEDALDKLKILNQK